MKGQQHVLYKLRRLLITLPGDVKMLNSTCLVISNLIPNTDRKTIYDDRYNNTVIISNNKFMNFLIPI